MLIESFKMFLRKKSSFVSGPDEIPWLIFEFMPFGDLLDVLKSNCGLAALHKPNLPTLTKVRIVLNPLLTFYQINYR